MMSLNAYQPETSPTESKQIRLAVRNREVVALWVEYIRDQYEHDRRQRWFKVGAFLSAFLVSLACIGIFLALALLWGAR